MSRLNAISDFRKDNNIFFLDLELQTFRNYAKFVEDHFEQSVSKGEKEYKKLKILSIGPRSEGEIFNLFANGFELKNIAGIDIFSYSPLIQLSDMHNIKLEDNKFDIVLMGWCLAYSNNKIKAINEAKRVLKKDGSLIIGYSVSSKSDQDIINERGYLVGSPYNKITSMKILDELIKFCGLKTFYSKTIDKKISQRLIYGAEK